MRRGLAYNIDEVQAQTSFTCAVRLATILTIRQALVTFQVALSACQAASSHALGLARRGRLFRPIIGIIPRHSHEPDPAAPTRLRLLGGSGWPGYAFPLLTGGATAWYGVVGLGTTGW